MGEGLSAQDQVSRALRSVIADFGSQLLGNPEMLGNLLKDHIPDHPREINVLQAAAQSGAAAAVDGRIRSGMAPAAAVRMTAAELTNSLAIDSAAAEWGVAEFAEALGYAVGPSDPAPAQPDVTVLPADQPMAEQPGVTIAAPMPPYTGQPEPQQIYPAAQPPAGRTQSRRPLIAGICAVVVVIAGLSAYLATRNSLTGAKCLVGSWSLQSGRQADTENSVTTVWNFTAGSQLWTFGSRGGGTVDERKFTVTGSSANGSYRNIFVDHGSFSYRVVGSRIVYGGFNVPGTVTEVNLQTGSKATYTEKDLILDKSNDFSCSGNTLRRYGNTSSGNSRSTYSFSYTRQ